MYTTLIKGIETKKNTFKKLYLPENESELQIYISHQIAVTMGGGIRALSNELTSTIMEGMFSKNAKR